METSWRREYYKREGPKKHHRSSSVYTEFPKYRKKPYDRSLNNSYHNQSERQFEQKFHNQADIIIPLSPLEIKIQNLVNAVQGQGIIGDLVLISSEKDNPTSVLQNAVQNTKDCYLNVALNSTTNKFQLLINKHTLGETDVGKGKQVAKNELCEMVLEGLKKKCFFIIKKENFEEVSTEGTNKEDQFANTFQGTKAFNMMLKMGWGGKGLGIEEQGEEKTVADKMVKNITKEGLGSINVVREVNQILQDYISSSKITTLAFDSSFSKEERAQIHNLAQKYNLKSKSQGKEPDRRITITRKIAKWDLVKELLSSDLENNSYKLYIPQNYQVLWQQGST